MLLQFLTEKAKGNYFTYSNKLTPYIEYLPEPYYGDINNFSCVIIDLNPGLSHFNDCKKLYKAPGAFLYNFFHSASYSVFNNKYSPFNQSSISSIGTPNEIPGAKWWQEKRVKWTKTFLAKYNSIINGPSKDVQANPLVFELCPWHSPKWDDKIVTGMNKHLANTVFTPAADAIKNSSIPFGLCFGKVIGDLLISLGFKVIYQRDNINPVNKWPLNEDKKLVDRTYRFLEGYFNNEKVYFLNLYANGTFYAPSAKFIKYVDPVIVQDILSLNL